MLDFSKRTPPTVRSNVGAKNPSSRAASTNLNKVASIGSHNSLIKEIRIYKEMRRANKANIGKAGSIAYDEDTKEHGLIVGSKQNRFLSVPCFNQMAAMQKIKDKKLASPLRI